MTHDAHRLRFESARRKAELDDVAERLVTRKWTGRTSAKIDEAIDRWDQAVDALCQAREGAA